MCLAVPGRLVERYESKNLQMGKIDFGGVTHEVCLEYLPELSIGDYAIVHVGFAIGKIDKESAEKTLEDFAMMSLAGESSDE